MLQCDLVEDFFTIFLACTWQEVRKNNVRTYRKESQSASIEDRYTAVDAVQMFCTQEVQ